MKKRRRTEITIETREVMQIRGGAAHAQSHCPVCGPDAQLIYAEEAVRRAEAGLYSLAQLIEKRGVHLVRSPEGRLMVCLRSLEEI